MLVIILIFELIAISAAWTACVLAPMPFNIIIPVGIVTVELIVKTITIYRHFRRRGKARGNKKPGRANARRKNGRSAG